MNIPNKTRKGSLRKTILTISIVLAVFLGICIMVLLTQKSKDLQISNVEIATIRDGVYTGSADNGLVKASVSVEVSNGTLLNISILEHEHLLGKKAEKITGSIIAQQSLEVDTITSATHSSKTLLKAVENALRKGE